MTPDLASGQRDAVTAAVLALAMVGGGVQAQSLYTPETYRPLVADNKAFRVGDVVTVQVVESASATVNTDTGSRRGNAISASVARVRSENLRVGLETTGDFDGGGRTARAGRLLAQLTVTVREILPNGDLRLEGEQLLTINDEQQRINLEGRARPQDLTDGNVVLSTRLAGARITYIGEGDLADRQRPAWWRRVLDWFGF